MLEIIIGGVVATLGSVVVTYWTRSRELATRWDNDRKIALIEMRLSVGQIRGNLYALATGSIPLEKPGRRPKIIATNMDKAYYDLTALAILFPELNDSVRSAQADLVSALDIAFEALQHAKDPMVGDEQSKQWYLEHIPAVGDRLTNTINAEIVSHCQRKLKLS